MNSGQKKILIVIVLMLVSTSIFAIFLSLRNSENNSEDPNGNSNISGSGNNNGELIISDEIVELENEELYFNIQNTINNYYLNLSNKNDSEIYKILDQEYIRENGITKNNVTQKIYSNYETVNYIATNIYFNKNSSVTYYFVSGYLFNVTMMSDSYVYKKNVNYLIIIKNGDYILKPLEDNIDIENYANNYKIEDIEINSDTGLSRLNVSEKNKLVMYINEFLNLLYMDTEKAYNMLDDETKSKYLNYYDFESRIDTIYNNLSTSIFAYSITENDNYIIYNIKDKSQKSIKITETRVMDYKIGY